MLHIVCHIVVLQSIPVKGDMVILEEVIKLIFIVQFAKAL